MERNSRREAVALFSAGDNTYAVCDISHSQPWDVVELFPKTDAVHLPDRRHSGGTASGIPDGKKLSAWDRYDPGSRSILRLDTCVGAQKGMRNKPAIVRLVLQGAEGPLRIHALVDSGNTLTNLSAETGIGAGRTDILSAVAGRTAWIPGDSLSQCREKERDP